ncbi:MAG: DUF559 domain-containing protein [Chloroflexi bacterium]|nr:DUF559 domain-containing protein [Chloroflexota bacterium]
MELQHVIWSWESVTQRLLNTQPDLGLPLFRSCRPIAAQRYRDGRLLVVLGCWWAADQEHLGREPNRTRLSGAVGSMLSEQVITTIVRWPGGLVQEAVGLAEGEQIPAPDVLKGVPLEDRDEASKCESAIQRLFFARSYAKGLRLRCQHPILTYRIDFALPERRVGADIMGWDGRTGPSGKTERRERQEHLEMQGWKILLFSGSQVLSNADKCVADLANLSQGGFVPGQQPLSTRYSPEARKPFSSIGIHRPPDDRSRKRRW